MLHIALFSRDGIAPSELLQIRREQLHPYDGVKFPMGEVIDVEPLGGSPTKMLRDRFQVTLNNGAQFVS